MTRALRLAVLLAAAPGLCAGAATAQEASPIATDRPGFLFSSQVVGEGTFQIELGLPQLTLFDGAGGDLRLDSVPVLVRYGLSPAWELRLGGSPYNRSELGGRSEEGVGDLELGVKWHLADGAGARLSFALIASLVLPTGDDGFSTEEPAYGLAAAAEWSVDGGWGLGAVAASKLGTTPQGDGFTEATLAVSLGRALADPRWSAYGEAAVTRNDLPGANEAAYLGGGVKWLATSNLQLDLSFDRGLSDAAADWLLGLGLAFRR